MKLLRREFLQLTDEATALSALPRTASAADYPTRPVHIISGFPPGAIVEIVAPAGSLLGLSIIKAQRESVTIVFSA